MNIGELGNVHIYRCVDINADNFEPGCVYHRIDGKNKSDGKNGPSADTLWQREDKMYYFKNHKTAEEQKANSHPRGGNVVEYLCKSVCEGSFKNGGKEVRKSADNKKNVEQDINFERKKAKETAKNIEIDKAIDT
jgi:hypothetical protein